MSTPATVVVIGAPQPWPPPTTSSSSSSSSSSSVDCTLQLCTVFCPQHCAIFAPPTDLNSSSSNSHLSPLMVALITLLASAFILLCYYTVISKYCKRRRDEIRRRRNRDRIEQLELESRLGQLIIESTTANPNQNHHNSSSVNNQQSSESGGGGGGGGLDERFIKSITVFRYKAGDGLIEGTDCAVCLNEFKEMESLRLMPNCQHAFHVECIDTWLKSQSSCPICRAAMVERYNNNNNHNQPMNPNPNRNPTATNSAAVVREQRRQQVETRSVVVVVRELEAVIEIAESGGGDGGGDRSGEGEEGNRKGDGNRRLG